MTSWEPDFFGRTIISNWQSNVFKKVYKCLTLQPCTSKKKFKKWSLLASTEQCDLKNNGIIWLRRSVHLCPVYWNEPEMWASSGVPGAISPLPLSSLAVTAKSLLQKSGLSDQHWSTHTHTMEKEARSETLREATLASTHLIEHKSQLHHFCTESTRSPTHGKTTVRWYSQLATPWELAVSHANGDQCTDSWICFPPKLLIIEMTSMWRGHSSQVTLIHLLSLLFPFD